MPKHRYTSLVIVFLSHLMLWSCSGCNTTKRVSALPPDDPSDWLPSVSSTLAVDVFIDATLSMRGFLVHGTSSYYEQTLQSLERGVAKGWDGASASYYRFGSHIAPITGRAHVEATQPAFYTNPEYFQKTFIENVIDQANIDNLTVIVTDLFQNDADVNLLTEKLKEKYLAKNLAVGILGIKSQFDGTVYDVGIRNYSFEYKSGNEQPERFRPFYVLILGKHADVARYYEVLKTSGLDEFPVKNFIIFSRFLENPLASFENGKIASTNKIVKVGSLLASGINDKRVTQLRLRDDIASGSFIAALKYFPLRYTMTFNPASLEAEVSAWQCQGNQLAESEQAKRAFHVNSANLSGDEMMIGSELVPSTLPGKGIYCFKVVLRPKEYQMPAWVSEWDMPIQSIEGWKQQPKIFNGATTFNLKPFLSDLWATVVQLHRPKLGEFYCYIQRG